MAWQSAATRYGRSGFHSKCAPTHPNSGETTMPVHANVSSTLNDSSPAFSRVINSYNEHEFL